MILTITIGWWLAPAAVTFGMVIWAFWPEKNVGYGMDVGGAFKVLVGIIVALAAWLVWSLAA